MDKKQIKSSLQVSEFGPFSLDLTPRLIIDGVTLRSDQLVMQFIGDNGSGKSTVLELIRQQLFVSNKSFSYLNQDYRSSWLWWKSARQNLEFSYERINPKSSFVESALFDRHRHWLEPVLKESLKSVFFEKDAELSTVQLSGGQLQRVIVLRELLHNPDYFLLDEAFSALDTDITAQIIDMLIYEQSLRPFVIISIAHSDHVRKLLGGDIFEFKAEQSTRKLSINKLQ